MAGADARTTGAGVSGRGRERGHGKRPERGQRLEPATTRRQRVVWSGVESTRPGTRDEMMPEQGPTSREGQSQNRQNRQNRQAKGRRRDAQQMRAKDRPAVVTTKHVGSAWSGAERTRPGSRARADELRRTEPEQPEQAEQAEQAEHADQATQGPVERDATEERRGESQRSRHEDDRICVE